MARKAGAHSGPVKVTAQARLAVIFGAEDMLKAQYLDELKAALRKEHGDFDTIYFDGITAPLADVLDEVRTYSLLQPFKLVVVDGADEFVAREGVRAALTNYAEHPVEQATLVLRGPTWRPGNLDKLIAPIGFIARCDPLPAAAAVPWLVERMRTAFQCTLDEAAARMLVDRLGANLMRLDSELAKLSVMARDGQPIGTELVESLVGRGSEAEKAFVIQDAILQSLRQSAGRRGGHGAAGGMLKELHELLDLAGLDKVPVQYAVADLMRKTCHAAILRAKGANDMKIAKDLGLWGSAKEGVLWLAGRVPPLQARRWFDRIVDMNLRERQGVGDPIRHLEMFCAQLAAETP